MLLILCLSFSPTVHINLLNVMGPSCSVIELWHSEWCHRWLPFTTAEQTQNQLADELVGGTHSQKSAIATHDHLPNKSANTGGERSHFLEGRDVRGGSDGGGCTTNMWMAP